MKIYSWHSINLVPTLDICQVVSDDEPHKRIGSWVQITIFGKVFSIVVPFNLPPMSTPIVGPMYSRRSKKWKWLKKETGQ